MIQRNLTLQCISSSQLEGNRKAKTFIELLDKPELKYAGVQLLPSVTPLFNVLGSEFGEEPFQISTSPVRLSQTTSL